MQLRHVFLHQLLGVVRLHRRRWRGLRRVASTSAGGRSSGSLRHRAWEREMRPQVALLIKDDLVYCKRGRLVPLRTVCIQTRSRVQTQRGLRIGREEDAVRLKPGSSGSSRGQRPQPHETSTSPHKHGTEWESRRRGKRIELELGLEVCSASNRRRSRVAHSRI
jgi:hypothetical protein